MPTTSANSGPPGIVGIRLSSLQRRELFIWLALIFFTNDILFLSVHPLNEQFGAKSGLLQAFTSKSIFYYLAWYVVLSRLIASNVGAATVLDVGLGLSAALLNAVPPHLGVWLGGSLTALYLLVARDDRNLTAAGTVLLALAFNSYWGPRMFDLLAYPLLRADAGIVGTILSLTQPDMSWEGTVVGNLQGHSVLIFTPCSSFHNISLGLLCWVSITKLFRLSWVRADLAVAFLVCAAVVTLNAIRLYLMALSPEGYQYWHFGLGDQIMAWAITGTVLLISLWGVLRIEAGP